MGKCQCEKAVKEGRKDMRVKGRIHGLGFSKWCRIMNNNQERVIVFNGLGTINCVRDAASYFSIESLSYKGHDKTLEDQTITL